MSIISKETFDNLPKEEKDSIFLTYKHLTKKGSYKGIYTDEEVNGAMQLMVTLFGKENLQSKPEIKTWEDVEKVKDSYKSMVSYLLNFTNDVKLNKKLAATFQIKLLIELGYGGMVTDEDWKKSVSYNQEDIIWTIVGEYDENKELQLRVAANWIQPELVSFHTKQQAEEFMSYPENRKLVEHYYMV